MLYCGISPDSEKIQALKYVSLIIETFKEAQHGITLKITLNCTTDIRAECLRILDGFFNEISNLSYEGQCIVIDNLRKMNIFTRSLFNIVEYHDFQDMPDFIQFRHCSECFGRMSAKFIIRCNLKLISVNSGINGIRLYFPVNINSLPTIMMEHANTSHQVLFDLAENASLNLYMNKMKLLSSDDDFHDIFRSMQHSELST